MKTDNDERYLRKLRDCINQKADKRMGGNDGEDDTYPEPMDYETQKRLMFNNLSVKDEAVLIFILMLLVAIGLFIWWILNLSQ